MAKRSQRRPSRHERDQAGCIWGLISMFDFRHGRSTRRLLADRRRVSKQPAGAGHIKTETSIRVPNEKYEDLLDVDESKMCMTDAAKTSVKELMEEEMFNEQGSRNQPNDSEMDLEQINAKNGNHKKNHRRRNRSCNRSRDMDATELDSAERLIDDQVLEPKPLNDLALETMMEEIAKIYRRNTSCFKHGFHGDVDIPSGQAVAVADEKLVAAVKLFIEQKLSSSKRLGEDENSKEFMDALKKLNLNNGLFLKLLEDPNSVLLKHMQDLEDVRLDKNQTPDAFRASDMSEEEPLILKPDELSSRKPRNFFRRRSKSMDSYPLGGDKGNQSPNKIVILKPGPGGAHSPETVSGTSLMDNKVDHERNTSQFSFTEIKRKLRHAMGKERQGISPDRLILKLSPKHRNGNNVDKGLENFGWSSPNRNHFYTEKFAVSSPSFKKGESVVKLKDKVSVPVNENFQYPRLGGSNIYIEAKKHLSEMLKNGDENVSMMGQLPKSLGRILSFPEYNGSPCCSPRKYSDDIFITSPMRLSPRSIVKNNVSGILQENNNNLLSPRKQNLESQPRISGGNSEDKEQSLNTNIDTSLRDDQEHSLQAQSSARDTIGHEVQSSCSIVAETESRPLEEGTITDISNEASGDSAGGHIQKRDSREVDSEDCLSTFLKEPSSCCKPDLLAEDEILSSPTMSPSHRQIKDSDCVTDKAERPSPVSILEPLFTDDDISPPGTISQPVEKDIHPRHIHFEEQSPPSDDQGICTRISLEGEESAFEYVEAVLLGSGLNWDEFLLRWLSTYEILDSSLFEEVELFSSRPHHDQKLLFDCANEALNEVSETYFGCFTGISHGKPHTRTIPKGMDLINEIWNRVEWHLFQHLQPHSLDQLIKRDLSSSEKWMNVRSDIELIGFEMEETIFTELVEDILLSFVDNTSECEFAVLQAEPEAVDNANS